MKKKEVKIGATYHAKVTGKLTTVKIMFAHPNGGWDAINLQTQRKIRIKRT